MSQQNQSTLQSAINTQLADNTSGAISAADVRDNLINMTDSLLFNSGSQGITGSLTATSFTGSLQGIATTASYVETAQTASYVLNAVSASRAISSSYAATSSTSTFANSSNNILHADLNSNGDYAITFTSGIGYATVLCRLNQATGLSPFTYNPSTSLLKITGSIIATGGFTGSLLGTATTASYVETAQTASYFSGTVISASYAATSSLSNETIGAGLYGGEIQFKGGTGIGSPNGKNTYSPAFTWNTFTDGLNIGDPLTTGGNGAYYLAVGVDSLANGNYSVAFGSGSYANGLGSFTHGKAITAAGDYSHAEGQSSSANGNYSHAEGLSVTANGEYSHAEGWNTLSQGSYSHAEGNSTNATGVNSHAEGQYSTAKGNGSHAEGTNTNSVGPFSHAEGIGTIASGSGQHVSGHYNTQGDNTSLFIIGNGDVNTEVRSDAFKVRMSGSIVLPTTQSAAPSWTGTDGEMVFATVTGNHFFYVWMAGAWRSGSLS
jgi:hypothetical protein